MFNLSISSKKFKTSAILYFSQQEGRLLNRSLIYFSEYYKYYFAGFKVHSFVCWRVYQGFRKVIRKVLSIVANWFIPIKPPRKLYQELFSLKPGLSTINQTTFLRAVALY